MEFFWFRQRMIYYNCGSKSFIKSLYLAICNNIKSSGKVYLKKRKGKQYWDIILNGRYAIEFADFIYRGLRRDSIYMKRKKEIFDIYRRKRAL